MDSYVPPPQQPFIVCTGTVVPTAKNSSVLHLPAGWRCLDVSTGFFDPESRKRVPQFTMRWFIDNPDRWKKFKTPPAGAVVELSGRCYGRIVDDSKTTRGEVGFLGAIVSTMDVLSWSGGSGVGSGAVSLSVNSGNPETQVTGSVYNRKRVSASDNQLTPTKQSKGGASDYAQSSPGIQSARTLGESGINLFFRVVTDKQSRSVRSTVFPGRAG